MWPRRVDAGPVSVVLGGERLVNVARLLSGAFASRLGLAFEEVDDVQLAVELVLRSLPAQGAAARLELACAEDEMTASLGEFEACSLERRLAEVDSQGLDLLTCLQRLVERVEIVGRPSARVVLAKTLPAAAA